MNGRVWLLDRDLFHRGGRQRTPAGPIFRNLIKNHSRATTFQIGLLSALPHILRRGRHGAV